MVPTKVPKEPEQLSFARASPWYPLPRQIQVDIGNWDKNVGETTESPVDG